MKNLLLSAVTFVTILCLLQNEKIQQLRSENDVYRANEKTLLSRVETYITRDSLNAATVDALTLQLSDYEMYRANDMEVIKQLQVKNRNLQSVTNTQATTIANLQGIMRDTIIYNYELPANGSLIDTLHCIDIKNTWFEFHGCTDNEYNFSGTFKNVDTLLIVETVKYKRFLGFLWKTAKIKNRKADVVSRNPYTTINDIEYITIKQ